MDLPAQAKISLIAFEDTLDDINFNLIPFLQ